MPPAGRGSLSVENGPGLLLTLRLLFAGTVLIRHQYLLPTCRTYSSRSVVVVGVFSPAQRQKETNSGAGDLRLVGMVASSWPVLPPWWGIQALLLQVKGPARRSSLERLLLGPVVELECVVSPAAWQSATAWTTGPAASVRPLHSSASQAVTDGCRW